MMLFDEQPTPRRKRRQENVNRSETLVIAGVSVLLNDEMVYIRHDMNDCDFGQLMDVMRQIRRSVQIESNVRQRLVIVGSSEMLWMKFSSHFERVDIRNALIARLHAEEEGSSMPKKAYRVYNDDARHEAIKKLAETKGYKSVSDYLNHLIDEAAKASDFDMPEYERNWGGKRTSE